MKINDVIAWLSGHKDERIKSIYQKNNPIEVMGVKLTDLREFAKYIGMDQDLADDCYDYPLYETKMLATMICSPKLMTHEKIKQWVMKANQTNIVDQGIVHLMLIDHSSYAKYLSWCTDENHDLRYGGFAFLASYFRQADLNEINIHESTNLLSHIENTILQESLIIQNAMNNAVVMAGLHVPLLVMKATEVAMKIGYILPLKVKNSCNIQSASDYLVRYQDNPKYSRVARLRQQKG